MWGIPWAVRRMSALGSALAGAASSRLASSAPTAQVTHLPLTAADDSSSEDVEDALHRARQDDAAVVLHQRPLDEHRVLGHQADERVVSGQLAVEPELGDERLSAAQDVGGAQPAHREQLAEALLADPLDVVLDELGVDALGLEQRVQAAARGARALLVDGEPAHGREA